MSSQVENHSNSGSSGPISRISQPTGEISQQGYHARLESFETYPLPHYVSIILLAKHGFSSTPDGANARRVTCVSCGKTIDSWNTGDVPYQQQFHNEGCNFVRDGPPSVTSGSITDVSLSQRASVNNGEELTKPLETSASASGFFSPHELPSQQPGSFSVRRFLEQSPHRRQIAPTRNAYSMPQTPHQEVSMLRMRSIDDHRGRTTDVTQIHARSHSQHGQEPHSYSPAPSLPVGYPSSFTGGAYRSGFSSGSGTPGPSIRTQQSSVHSQPRDEYQQLRSRLENPDDSQTLIDNLDLRNAQDRLYTFQQFWPEDSEFRNIRLLAQSGLYCIGQGDAVECFSCHTVIANWSRNDNPMQRHADMYSHCRFVRGQNCGDIPLPVQRVQRSTAGRGRTEMRTRHASQPYGSIAPSRSPSNRSQHSHHSSPMPSIISQPSMEGIASGPLPEIYSNPPEAAIRRSNLLQEFPCQNAENESMREERERLRTFTNPNFRRHANLRASDQALARAGLYYTGQGDKVKCWFCGGGIRDFQYNDDPWEEHAKFFPQCEYLLQQKGPEYINRISILHPNVERPLLPRREPRFLPQVVSSPTPLPPPPQIGPSERDRLNRQMLQEGMQTQMVQSALTMGYSEQRIRQLQWERIMTHGCCYQTSEAFFDDLIGEPTASHQPHDSPHHHPLSNVPSNSFHIQGGNFIGPSWINGQYYPPSANNGIHFSTSSSYQQPQSSGIIIDGQPFEQYMANAFSHPFFHGEVEPFINTGSTTIIRTNTPPYTTTFNNIGGEYSSNIYPNPTPRPVRPPAPSVRPAAPAVRPPTPPPLRAVDIPRLPGRSSGTSASSSAATTSTSSAGASSQSGTRSSAATEERLRTLERERLCKVCLNEPADILFRPCNHICSCLDCARRVRECPVCRARITTYIRTYHS